MSVKRRLFSSIVPLCSLAVITSSIYLNGCKRNKGNNNDPYTTTPITCPAYSTYKQVTNNLSAECIIDQTVPEQQTPGIINITQCKNSQQLQTACNATRIQALNLQNGTTFTTTTQGSISLTAIIEDQSMSLDHLKIFKENPALKQQYLQQYVIAQQNKDLSLTIKSTFKSNNTNVPSMKIALSIDQGTSIIRDSNVHSLAYNYHVHPGDSGAIQITVNTPAFSMPITQNSYLLIEAIPENICAQVLKPNPCNNNIFLEPSAEVSANRIMHRFRIATPSAFNVDSKDCSKFGAVGGVIDILTGNNSNNFSDISRGLCGLANSSP